jgi:hypothetical protein
MAAIILARVSLGLHLMDIVMENRDLFLDEAEPAPNPNHGSHRTKQALQLG